jgi:hypothetical protein
MKKLTVIIASCILFSNVHAQTEANLIGATGYVGIGTTTPSSRLTVDPHGSGGILIGNTGTGNTSMSLNLSGSTNGYGLLQVVKSSGTSFGDLSINYSGGNVGVGTIAPIAKLDVSGNIHSSGIIYNGYGQLNTDGGLELGPIGTGAASTPYIDFHYGTGTPEDYNVRIHNYANNTLAIFSQFSANALLRVVGNIITKKLQVTQTPWADFVFADDYRLPPLMQVENYIKLNKHLAEIPSAEEVEKNGIDVGEMNAKLLQKVEELTLYLIQQQKMIEEQNKRITQLENVAK